MSSKIDEVKSYFVFSIVSLCISCIVFLGSTITSGSKTNFIIWGSIFVGLSLCLLIAGFYTKKERSKILELGKYLDAVVKVRFNDPETLQVSLVVTYELDGKEILNAVMDSFNNDCSIQAGDTIKVCVYNGKVLLVEEDLNEK